MWNGWRSRRDFFLLGLKRIRAETLQSGDCSILSFFGRCMLETDWLMDRRWRRINLFFVFNYLSAFREKSHSQKSVHFGQTRLLLCVKTCLGRAVIRNQNNKSQGGIEKKRKPRHFSLMSAQFYLHTMKMIYFLQEVGKQTGDKERKRNGLSARWEKKFQMPWTIHRWDG